MFIAYCITPEPRAKNGENKMWMQQGSLFFLPSSYASYHPPPPYILRKAASRVTGRRRRRLHVGRKKGLSPLRPFSAWASLVSQEDGEREGGKGGGRRKHLSPPSLLSFLGRPSRKYPLFPFSFPPLGPLRYF